MGGASLVTHSLRIEVGNGSSGDDFDGEASNRAETSSTDTGKNYESGMTDFLISGTIGNSIKARSYILDLTKKESAELLNQRREAVM
jgi:hypothetical protein